MTGVEVGIEPVVSCDTATGAARSGAEATWCDGGSAEAVTGGARPVPSDGVAWATFLGFGWMEPVEKGLPKASPKRLESAEQPLIRAATAVMAQI